jgi:hypothetical protein
MLVPRDTDRLETDSDSWRQIPGRICRRRQMTVSETIASQLTEEFEFRLKQETAGRYRMNE